LPFSSQRKGGLITEILLACDQKNSFRDHILTHTHFNPDGFKGIGPVKALKLIKSYGRLENIPDLKDKLESIDHQSIREIFLKPKVINSFELRWREPDINGIVEFLCHERDFSETRVRSALTRLEVIEKKKSETLERWFS